MTVWAIVGAGGIGKRMGAGKNKVLLKVAGKEVLAHTLQVFEGTRVVDKVLLVIHPDNAMEAQKLVKKYAFKKVHAIVQGGRERQDSVWNGLQKARELGAEKGDFLCIHNGANPLVQPAEIKACLDAARETKAAVLGFKVKDTLRRVSENLVSLGTVDRKGLWAMQTPQCIEFSLAWNAFENAMKEGFYGTDDVQLVERMGHPVRVVECGYENIKLTTPEDLRIAEGIFKQRAKK
ncbi:MAG: 2-C-methyl-D-erythritol 4-phosphate cytidylyltransferase [Candidatus Diapherotrites archaeon]|nr:2-C-methyl-D-erythritol 4-phosphate cytidylyltransferase [Candidatus Diapherotrites archaeon]